MPMFPIDELRPATGLALQIEPEIETTWQPTWGEAFRAAATDITAVSLSSGLGNAFVRSMTPAAPGYDPFAPEVISGYEEFASSFVDVESPDEAWLVKRKIDRERAADRTMAEAGASGVVAGLAAGLIDPINLLPGGVALKGVGMGRVVFGVGTGAAVTGLSAAAAEGILQASQETRSLEESAFAVGTATILGGMLGGAFGAVRSGLIPGVRSQADLERSLEAALAETLPGGGPASAGAAASKSITLEGEGLAPALGAEKLTAFTNPLMRGLSSPSAEVRSFVSELAEIPLWQEKNLRGEASPVAVETLVKLWDAPLARALTDMDDAFVSYRLGRDRQFGDIARIGAGDLLGNRRPEVLSRAQFSEAVAYAMRRGDQSGIPEVAAAAKSFRENLFDPLKQRAIDAGLLDEGVEVTTADSYLTRVYDRERIIARRPEFERIIADWLDSVRADVEARFETAQKAIAGSRAKVEKLDAQIAEIEAKIADIADLDTPAGWGEVEALKRTIEILKASQERGRKGIQRGQDRIEGDRIFSGLDRQEVDDIARQVTDTILGAAPGRIDIAPMTWATKRGPMKERTLNIPDRMIEGFLVNDIERIARVYKRSMAPDVEIAERFGSIDLDAQIDKINESYARLRDRVAPKGAEVPPAPPAQQQSWISRAVEKIREVIDAAKQPGHAPAKASLGRVSDWLAAEAKRAGLDISGFRHAIDGSAIRHMINRHTNAKTEANRGQIPLTEADFTAIPDVLASPDALVFGTKTQGNKDQIAFIKRMPDGSILYLEEVRTGKRELAAMSMRKYPAAKDFSAIVDTLPSNARSDGGVTLNVVDNAEHVTAIEPDGAAPVTAEAVAAPPAPTPEQERAQKALDGRRKSDVADLLAMRDRIRGTYAMPTNPDGLLVRSGRAARHLNLISKLGLATIASIGDIGRPIMIHGLGNVFANGITPLLRRSAGVKLAAEEARLASVALDMVLDSRAGMIADIADEYGRTTKVERGLAQLSGGFGKVSLLGPWTDAMKQMSALVGQTRFLNAAKAWAGGEALSRTDLADMAAGGIDQSMAARVAEQWAAHGDTVEGVAFANTTAWTDREAVTAFRAAILKTVDTAIVTPGQDKPLWMSKEWGKTLGQFRSFIMSATVRVTVSALQRRDGATVAGLGVMVALGMLQYWLRVPAEKRSDNPAAWVAEGVDRSGALGWLMEVNNTAEKLTSGRIGVSGLLGEKPLSRYASRSALDSLLGPTFGLAGDVVQLAGAASTGTWGGGDTARLRRLLPYQNVFYLRGLFDQIEAGANNALGVK